MTKIKILATLVFLSLCFFINSCSTSDREGDSSNQSSFKKLYSLYKKGNYFKLRYRLQTVQNTGAPKMLFLRAVTYNAFNKPAKSNKIIEQVLGSNSSLADTLMGNLRSLKLSNHLRLYQYHKALKAAKAIIKAPEEQTDSAEVADAKNMSKLLEALADAPPQKVAIQKATTLPIKRDKAGLQRIPVQLGGTQHHFVLDTGAGFSTIMRSVAQKAGMKIKKAGVKVKSATGGKVRADIAIADKVVLGHVKYQNVVFLVFPDKALSFPQINYRIPGIIGFPVIKAAGEIRFVRDSLLKIPADPPIRTKHNLALKGLSPRVLTGIEISTPGEGSIKADSLVCTLDTGAKSTMLLAPFYRHYYSQVKRLGRRDTIQVGGAGGSIQMSVYLLPEVQVRTGGARVTLKNVKVLTQTSFEDTQSGLACNIGQDVLSQFDKTIINFQSMSFLLRKRN